MTKERIDFMTACIVYGFIAVSIFIVGWVIVREWYRDVIFQAKQSVLDEVRQKEHDQIVRDFEKAEAKRAEELLNERFDAIWKRTRNLEASWGRHLAGVTQAIDTIGVAVTPKKKVKK